MQTNKLGILFILVVLFCSARAQENQKTWHWIKQLGGTGWDITNGITADSKNRIYIAGGFTNNFKAENKAIEGQGGRDIYVAQFNDKGKLLWVWNAGGKYADKVTGVCVASDDDLFITGMIEGEMRFGKVEIKDNSKKIFVSRISSKGKCQWIKTFPYNGSASAFLIESDRKGNVVVGGTFTESIHFESLKIQSKGHNDAFLIRLDGSGNLMHFQQIGGSGFEHPTAICTDFEGNTYLSLKHDRELQLDQRTFPAKYKNKKSNGAIILLDSLLNYGWVKSFYSPEYAEISGMVFTSNKNLILTGNYNNYIEFDTIHFQSNGTMDFFVANADSVGNIKWIRNFGGKYNDRSKNIYLNKLGSAMITGSFKDSIEFDAYDFKTQGNLTDAYVIQLDTAGHVTWAGIIDGEGVSNAKASALDNEGNLYITGSFTGSVDVGEDQISSFGDEDVFLAKYFNCPPADNVIKGLDYICPGTSTILKVNKAYENIIWNDTIFGVNNIEVKEPGWNNVRMIDKKGCIVKDSVFITQRPEYHFSLGKDTSLTLDEHLKLSGPTDFHEYLWQDFSVQPNYLVINKEQVPGIYDYSLTVTDSMGCNFRDSISIKYFTTKDRNDLNLGDVLIYVYPNPVHDKLAWSFKADKEVSLEVEIIDINGHQLYYKAIDKYHGEEMKINVHDLKPGTYFLTIKHDQRKLAKKVIKK